MDDITERVPIAAQPSADVSAGAARVVCPRCAHQTDSLKSRFITTVIFVLVYIVWNTQNAVACPACMRRLLVRRLLLAIPLSNLLFPFVGVVYLFQILGTFAQGHSSVALAEAHTVGRDEQLQRLQAKINRRRPPRKEWIVLAIVVLLCAAFWGVGIALKLNEAEPVVNGRALSVWIDDLRNGDKEQRRQAASVMGNLGERARRAVPELRTAARFDADGSVRYLAYDALLRIDPSSAADLRPPSLLELLAPKK